MNPTDAAMVTAMLDQLAREGRVVLEAGTTRPRLWVKGWNHQRGELVLRLGWQATAEGDGDDLPAAPA